MFKLPKLHKSLDINKIQTLSQQEGRKLFLRTFLLLPGSKKFRESPKKEWNNFGFLDWIGSLTWLPKLRFLPTPNKFAPVILWWHIFTLKVWTHLQNMLWESGMVYVFCFQVWRATNCQLSQYWSSEIYSFYSDRYIWNWWGKTCLDVSDVLTCVLVLFIHIQLVKLDRFVEEISSKMKLGL